MRDVVIYLFPPLRRPPEYIRVLYDSADTENGLYSCEVVGGPYDGLKLTEQTFRLYAQGWATLEEIFKAPQAATYLDNINARHKSNSVARDPAE